MLSTQLIALVALVIRTQGRDAAVRMLTIPQASIRAIPGRRNQDVAEIQSQSQDVAEQIVQLVESIYDPAFVDPDDLNSIGSLLTG